MQRVFSAKCTECLEKGLKPSGKPGLKMGMLFSVILIVVGVKGVAGSDEIVAQ